jgi:hypothetical protein
MEDKKVNGDKTPASHARDPTWQPYATRATPLHKYASSLACVSCFVSYSAYLAFQELRDSDPKEAILAGVAALMAVHRHTQALTLIIIHIIVVYIIGG